MGIKQAIDSLKESIASAFSAYRSELDSANNAAEARKNTVDQKIQTIEQNMRDAGRLNQGTIPDARLPTNARGSKTVSTSFPSGGSNGDTWLKY